MKKKHCYEDTFNESMKYVEGDVPASRFLSNLFHFKLFCGNTSMMFQQTIKSGSVISHHVDFVYESPVDLQDWSNKLDDKIDLHRRLNDAVVGLGNFEAYCAGYPYTLLEADSEKFKGFKEQLEEELNKVRSLRESVKQRECMTMKQIVAAQSQMRVIDCHLQNILKEYGMDEDLAKQVNAAIESINKAYSDAPLYVLLYAIESVYNAYVKLAKEALDYEEKVKLDYEEISRIYDSYKNNYIDSHSEEWWNYIKDYEAIENGLSVCDDLYRNRLLRNPVYIYKMNCESEKDFLTGLYHNSSYTWDDLWKYFECKWFSENLSNRIKQYACSESSVSDYDGIFVSKEAKEKALGILRKILELVDKEHAVSYLLAVAFSMFKKQNLVKLRDDGVLFVDTIWKEVSREVDCGLKSSRSINGCFEELNKYHADLHNLPEDGVEEYSSKIKTLVETKKYVEERLFKGPVRITSSRKSCSPMC